MKLMIVESPNKTKKIASILGADWKVVASVGHVRDLPVKSIGVSAPDFVPDYEPTDRGADILKKIGYDVKQAAEVYLATDPDREGEAIAWHLQQALKLKSYKRVTFNEITETGIMNGINNTRLIDNKVVAAQEARRVLDRLVGYTVSPVLCNIFNQRLSAGRVQSPALKLLVTREREIRNFISKKHYGVEALFPFKATWNFSNFTDEKIWQDREFAEQIARKSTFFVNECEETEKRVAPAAPFTTSTLQQAASVSLNIGSKDCMDLAQELFAAGLITYHRTDSVNFSAEAIKEIRDYAVKKDYPIPEAGRKFKSKDSAQEAHEAIRPTDFENEQPVGLSGRAMRLYEMIWKRALASQLSDAVYDVRKVQLSAGVENGKEVIFNAVGSMIKLKGWKTLIEAAAESEESADPTMSNPVPKLLNGVKIEAQSTSIEEKATKPPSRFTQATLIKKLEDEGIGRPSTYAAIIEGLLNRDYAAENKKQFVPTELGEKVFDKLDKRFSFMELDFTREMESDLDLIASSKMQYKEAIGKAYEALMREMPSLQSEVGAVEEGEKIECPTCKTGHLQRKKGANGFFWGCSAYKEGCKHTQPDNKGKPGERVERKEEAGEVIPCPECKKGHLRRIKGSKGFFWGCSAFRDGCKKIVNDKNGKPELK